MLPTWLLVFVLLMPGGEAKYGSLVFETEAECFKGLATLRAHSPDTPMACYSKGRSL